MQSDRSSYCGCKGIRTCIKCEKRYHIKKLPVTLSTKCYNYCNACNLAVRETETDHSNHADDKIEFPGVYIKPDFITVEEEQCLIQALDSIPWDPSQSGRRKQNFGPKCNFKKRKLQIGRFNGFPRATKFVQDKFSAVELLKNYQTIEQCSLEYDPENGASIDSHIDDCWIWGERIVTVNLLSDSVLTMVPYCGDLNRYNLNLSPDKFQGMIGSLDPDMMVRVQMPRRSLLVISGEARYLWEHMILRQDIQKRRVCLAYREFTPPYLPGGHFEVKSKSILDKAQVFW